MPTKREMVEKQGRILDSDRSCVCPSCGAKFDGEVHTWEAGSEECPDCDYVFAVEAVE